MSLWRSLGSGVTAPTGSSNFGTGHIGTIISLMGRLVRWLGSLYSTHWADWSDGWEACIPPGQASTRSGWLVCHRRVSAGNRRAAADRGAIGKAGGIQAWIPAREIPPRREAAFFRPGNRAPEQARQ